MPFIYDKVSPFLPLWPRSLVIAFWLIITLLSVILLIAIFRQTRKSEQDVASVTLIKAGGKSRVTVDGFEGQSSVPIRLAETSDEANVDMQDMKLKIKPFTTDEPEISIEIDKCSWGNSVRRYNQLVHIIEVALTLEVKTTPVNITDLQLYMGDEMLKLQSPTMPITQENKRRCYIAKYEFTVTTIYSVPKEKRGKYHIHVVTKRQEVDSEVFSLNNP